LNGAAEKFLKDELEFTGERFTPECVREIRYEHFHRYGFARELVAGKRVLDAACGEGYGSALLAASATSVIGVDRSEESIAHAQGRYPAPNLDFQTADCLAMPFDADSFDCVVSFETLEHLEDHDGLLREFRRVLRPDGFLLLSSPDKAVYSEQLQNRNEFHVRELYRTELETLLSDHFAAFRLYGQKLMFQSAIWSLDGAPGVGLLQDSGGELRASDTLNHAPVYFIALCAAEEQYLPKVANGLSLFDDAEESVYRHYYHEIRKNMAAGELLAGKDRELADLRAGLETAGQRRSWWRRLLGGR
jgi:SAM-dependent methyltransferase